MTGTTPAPCRWARLEWALALAAAAASVAVLCWAGRDTWFRLDVWDFLAGREAGSFESWIRPHAGHLQMATVGLHRLLYGAVGLDFWPWYYLPHVVGYAGLALLLWRAQLRRGAGRGVAFAAFLVVLSLGVSAFLSSIAIGGLVVMALLLLVAERLDADAAPSVLERVLVALALLVMVTTSSLGVAGLGACLLALALTRGLRRWWWCFVPATAAYGAWYLTRGGDAAQGSVEWDYLLHAPVAAVELAGNAAGRLIGVGGGGLTLGVVVVVALAAGFGWLAWKRKLRRWDLVFLGTLAGYLLMVTLVRGAAGKIPLEAVRYSYPLILLAGPLVVPRLRLPARRPAAGRVAILAVVGGCLVGLNAWQRVADTNAIEKEAFGGRVAIETVGQLVAAGEPAIDTLRLKNDLGIGMGGVLTVADVRAFLADGWVPAPPQQFARKDEVRGLLRFNATREKDSTAPPPLLLARDVPGGCVEVRLGASRRFTVAAAGEFSLKSAGRDWPTPVELAWRDGFGEFSRDIVVTGRMALATATPPAGGATLGITNRGEKRLRVCGVVGQEG
ncbi:MAG: hypothetical protein ABIJ48_12810 [Actinomycetota bacterium]